jgi:hypothetical protein
MVAQKTSSPFIPKTVGGWIVFTFTVILPALAVAGSGLKEVGFMAYDIINNTSKEKRIEQEIQNNLWIKNKQCYKDMEPYVFLTENKEKLALVVCPDSGDLYVELMPKDPKLPITHKWIEIPRVKPVAFNLFTSELMAQTKQHTFLQRQITPEKGILCRTAYQKFIIEVRKYEDESCVLIKKYFTGALETKPVSCTTDCREDL